MGDPRDEENTLDQWLVLIYVMSCIIRWRNPGAGCAFVTGREKMAGAGNYYPPTVLANVTPEMTVFGKK